MNPSPSSSPETDESRFFDTLVRERLPVVRHGLLLAIGLYGAFGILDWYLFPQVIGILALIRLAFIVTAAALFLLLTCRQEQFIRRSQPLLVAATLVAGFGIIAMDHLVSPFPRGDIYYAGIALTLVFSTIYFPIRFVYVVLNCVLLVLGYNLSLATYSDNLPVAVCNNFFLIATALACGMGCRNNERLLLDKCRSNRLISDQKSEIEVQRHRADDLLRQILPDPIAERMMEGDAQIADGYADVTVLFADISGFTEYSSTVSPRALVRILNRIFSGFDEVAESVGVEKIKTIGDGYMAVCGLPNEVEDHPERMIRMAIGMCHAMENIRAENPDIHVGVRIGIHTGPCIAGIIGKKRFVYDLWGDAVNLASRMESTGVPGKIQVSEATYLRVRDKYRFEPKREVNVKGRGLMPAYILCQPQETTTTTA